MVKLAKMMIIKLLLFLYFLVFPFGQFTRLPLQLIKAPETHLYLTDLVIAGLVGCWLVWKLVGRKKFVPPPLTSPIFLFAGFAFFSLIFNTPFRVNLQGEPLLSSREVGVAGLYLLRWVVYAGIYFVIYESTLLHGYMATWLIGAGVVSAIFGLLQYIFLPDTRFLKFLNWDPHYYRVIGTFLDPGFLGMILVLTLILLVSVYWEKLLAKKPLFFIHYSLFIILYSALVLTYARSAYLAYLVGMGVIAFKKRAPKFFALIFFVWLVTILLLPRPGGEGVRLERESTVQARILNWKQSLVIIRDHPLFGVGFNAYRYIQRDYGFLKDDWQISHAGAGADSSLLFVLATTGIFGFGAYLWLWREIFRIDNLTVTASALALLVHSLFNNSLFYPWIVVWMWVLLGVFSRREA